MTKTLRYKHVCETFCPMKGVSVHITASDINGEGVYERPTLWCIYSDNQLMLVEIDGKAV